MTEIERLQTTWKEIYSRTLPGLARVHDPAQPTWPVTLDHCFARIILDNTVGEAEEQWDKRLKQPAVRNMSVEQLQNAIRLAKGIINGDEDLVALDLRSLEVRGKLDKKCKEQTPASAAKDQEEGIQKPLDGLVKNMVETKRKNAGQDDGAIPVRTSKKARTSGKQSTLRFVPSSNQAESLLSAPASEGEELELFLTLHKIKTHPALTPYRKRLYAALLSVPKCRYTTYATLSDFLGSSARAVGMGMRNNPFAPEVPCHRVLASDGTIGGFGGSWGPGGENAIKKYELLKEEGVRFDSTGRVKGPPFKDFVDLLETG